jgi:pimeloyl-ACP methyl ester carboxylesterase
LKNLIEIFSPFFWVRLVVNWRMKSSGLKLYSCETDKYFINYWDNQADKPTVLLIQAFAAESQYTWHKQVRSLRKDFRVVIPNFLYFGGSYMKGEKSYAMQDQIDAIHELVQYLKIGKLMLCGASIGGVIATEFTDQFPDKVTKLILSNSPLKYDQEEDLKALLKDFGLTEKTDLFVPRNHKQLHRLFGVSYYRKPPLPAFVFKSIYRHMYLNADDKRKLVEASSIDLEKLRSKQYNINVPILLLWGSNDLLCPVSVAEQLKAHFGENAKMEVIPKTAHMANYEKPWKYNRLLGKFLKN